ncbi:unnamed protein product [Bursaphelenchus okinawaensis]|uniref:Tyrosine-protein kinase n=1 Tax=Bursaphelenchus okinawaensis TaxID=465554 RepID=A0A811L943_9BILA|nr:unnamed protein product [Bursaphelenchus okinawaensis]CAG9120149.1 unnamed protein product [Bursaphelenchus okinawaensis]
METNTVPAKSFIPLKIKLPKGAKVGVDPFDKPEELLPIDDSFGQIPYPVDKDGHIILTGGDPNFVDGVNPDAKKEEGPAEVILPEKIEKDKAEPGSDDKEAQQQPQVAKPEVNNFKFPLPKGEEEATEEEYEEKVVDKEVGEEGITELDYYHGLLPQEDVKMLLNKPGDFLIKILELSATDRVTCLVVKPVNNGQQVTFRIKNKEGKFFIDPNQSFDSVVQLVNHYMKSKKPLGANPCTLVKPICRQEWEFTADQVELSKQIGKGAYGQVYMGKLTVKDQPPKEVAVKQMKVSEMNKEKVEESMREARLMRMMRHKNVVRCFGVVADQEPMMILMELVPGGALDNFLRTNGPKISISERVSMCFDAAKGLMHVHRRGIIHRDVAARNCLYGKGVLKITDFGLSRQASVYIADPSERTPIKYLAPEVFNTRTYTFQSDVWAFGVLMFEIFSNGADPFPNKTGPQIKQIVCFKPTLLTPPPWAPDYVKAIMNECFIKDPHKRTRLRVVCKTIVTIKMVEEKHPDLLAKMTKAKLRMNKDVQRGKPSAAKPKGTNSKKRNVDKTERTKEESEKRKPNKAKKVADRTAEEASGKGKKSNKKAKKK